MSINIIQIVIIIHTHTHTRWIYIYRKETEKTIVSLDSSSLKTLIEINQQQ